MEGYVTMDITAAGEGMDGSDLERSNLTIKANFDDGTVTTRATDFSGFDISDPNAPALLNNDYTGELKGRGNLVLSVGGSPRILSNLNGDIKRFEGGSDNDPNPASSPLCKVTCTRTETQRCW
ncbi:MAG: hypothetical protein GDA49_01460 [Rhodospirillales bacterium]|nr:hypothetical protein [Rhodospirillales bacterium]